MPQEVPVSQTVNLLGEQGLALGGSLACFEDAAGTIPSDLTGHTAELLIADSYQAADSLFVGTIANGAIVVLGNVLTYRVPPSATAVLPTNKELVWQFRLRDAASEPIGIFRGTLRILPQVPNT